MKEYFKIAWRNLWRNRRRTMITSASILFAVFFALVMRSFQLGSYDNMIKNTIESFSGFLQIKHQDFDDERNLDYSIEYHPDFITQLEGNSEIKAVVPRIEYGALASTGNQSKYAIILGIDPVKEAGMTDPQQYLVRYRITREALDQLKADNALPEELFEKVESIRGNSYTSESGLESELKLKKDKLETYMPIIREATQFEGNNLVPGDDGILVSDRFSKYFKLNIGDTLILMGGGYHGHSAAGLFPVRGIIKVPAPDLDNKLIYMTLTEAQEFFTMEGLVTSVALNLNDNSDKNMLRVQEQIEEILPSEDMIVNNWKEFNKVLAQQIEGDNKSGIAMMGLLYFIIFFGIFGTVLMMIHERFREFGVMVSIGMRRTKLAAIMIIEMFFMGILGVVSGTAISLPILYLGYKNPIRISGDSAKMMEDMGFEPVMPFAWIDDYILWQGVVVAFMVVLSCIYPLRKVLKLKEVEALRA